MRTEKEWKLLLERYHRGACTPEEIRLLEAWFLRAGESAQGTEPSYEDVVRMLENIRRSPRYAPIHAHARPVRWRRLLAAASVVLAIVFSYHWFSARRADREAPIQYVTVAAGQGEVRHVLLPDSSEVWLNARTELAYRKDFAKGREVRLAGEAAFHVRKDDSRPFTVITPDSVETTVLGTEFNVKSYGRMGYTQVSVSSGRVRVGLPGNAAKGVLGKDESFTYDRESRAFTRENINAAAAAGWVNGQWVLEDGGLESLATLLYNHYGITLTWESKALNSLAINANFRKGQDAEEIISTFCLLGNCRYRWISPSEIKVY